MALTPKEMVEQAIDFSETERRMADQDRFLVYHGKLKEILLKAIRKEFEKNETIMQMASRLIPLNITQKIINKLSVLYLQNPIRRATNKDLSDQELLDNHVNFLCYNQAGKTTNRLVELQKMSLQFPYLDRDGKPGVRVLPSHMFTPFSDDPIQPDRPTGYVIHKTPNETMKEKMRFAVWTKEKHLILDGQGLVMRAEMEALNNPDGVNPYGVLPQTMFAEHDDGMLIPIQDDDLISMQLAINILLTDAAFASKFQLWSIIFLKGVASGTNIDFSPNSIGMLPPGVDVEVVKPIFDADKAMAFAEMLVGMLLTTKNLSVGSISGKANAIGSGVAEMIDRAETTEDRKDQEEYFRNGEKEFWTKYAKNILPFWVNSGLINPKYAGQFSEDFEMDIEFMDPKPFMGDLDLAKLQAFLVDEGLTTKEMALQAIHKNMTKEQVQDLLTAINKGKIEQAQFMVRNMMPVTEPQQDDGTDNASV